MPHSPPPEFLRSPNDRAWRHLAEQSAHSDIVSVLQAAVKPLGDVQLFCPDPQSYRVVVSSTKGVLFGCAVGQATVAFRLDARMRDRALRTGAEPYPECGSDWVAVIHSLPDDDWPQVDVRFWARKAYVHARDTSASPRG